MLENEAKGWYGNYSVIGKNLVERFHLLLRKDEILSGKPKKLVVKDFFDTEEKKEKEKENRYIERKKNNKNIKEIDIFSESFDRVKKEKLKIKDEEKKMKQADLCASEPKYEFKEKYKFHQSHHGNKKNKIIKISQNNISIIASYNPKMDFIWKKTKIGPQWKLTKGRYIEKNDKDNKNKYMIEKRNNLNIKKMEPKNIKKFDSMNKQTKRGIIPISYDLRIRTDKAFIPRKKIIEKKINILTNNKNLTTKNKTIYLDIPESFKNKEHSKAYSNKIHHLVKAEKILSTDHSRNTEKFINGKKKNIKILNLTKKLDNNKVDFSPIKVEKNNLNHTIDFSKVLPRDTNLFLTQSYNRTSQPLFNPSYKFIEPRSLTMVLYSKKIKNKSTPKKFEGIDPQIFYDVNKVINKVNNHKEANAPNFNIMAGRNWDDGPLPSFMVKLCDRKSLETINDKGLKMNNYANIDFQNNYSTFQPKKSFNKLINYTMFKNDKEIVEEEIKKINKEIFGDNKLKRIINKYTKDEYKNKEYSGTMIDGITFKTIKTIKNNEKNI